MSTHHDGHSADTGIVTGGEFHSLSEVSKDTTAESGLHKLGEWEVREQVGLTERDLHRLGYALETANLQLLKSPAQSSSQYDPIGSCFLLTDKTGRTVELSGKTEVTGNTSGSAVFSSEASALSTFQYPRPLTDPRIAPEVSLDLVVRVTQNDNLNSALIRGAAYDRLRARTNTSETIIAIASAVDKTVQIHKLSEYPVVEECSQYGSTQVSDLVEPLLATFRNQGSNVDVCSIRTNTACKNGKAKHFPTLIDLSDSDALQDFLIGQQGENPQKLGMIAIASKTGVPTFKQIDAIYEAAKVNRAERFMPVLLWEEATHTLYSTTPHNLMKAKELVKDEDES